MTDKSYCVRVFLFNPIAFMTFWLSGKFVRKMESIKRPSFDQLPNYVVDLSQKVDYLTELVKQLTSPKANRKGGVELAVQKTGLSKTRIYTLVSERKIPHSKRGGRLYFSESALDEWIEAGNRQTREELSL